MPIRTSQAGHQLDNDAEQSAICGINWTLITTRCLRNKYLTPFTGNFEGVFFEVVLGMSRSAVGINVSHVTRSVRIASKSRQGDSCFVPQYTQCSKFVTVTILTCWSRDACISILHMYAPHLRATESVHNTYKHQGISEELGKTRTTFDIEYPLTSSRHSSRY